MIPMNKPAIQLLVGLGNPGIEYQYTRHNIGFWFIDLLAKQYDIQLSAPGKFYGALGRGCIHDNDVRLFKPLTFMNRSGQGVAAVSQYFNIAPNQIIVIHDELDLPAGKVKLKNGGGHAGHNGLRDIINAINSKDFWRIRLGIDRPIDRKPVVDYVLSRPSQAQMSIMLEAITQTCTYVPEIIAGNFSQVMNNLHKKTT
ncbi:peptidyl-tRNA hydrolase [Achromatium sp. WMS1]|nr:peptidyl-tRNA hydrolase [Achromatium sp. WMS1]